MSEAKFKPKPGEVVVVQNLPMCNFGVCEEDGIYDFQTRMGPWANACDEHYVKYRAYPDLGVGKGQRLITRDQIDNG